MTAERVELDVVLPRTPATLTAAETKVLATGVALGEFNAAMVTAHCRVAPDDVTAILDQHPELFERLARFDPYDCGANYCDAARVASSPGSPAWRVIDRGRVRSLLLVAEAALPHRAEVLDADIAPAEDRLRLAELTLTGHGDGASPRRRRIRASTALILVRQYVADAGLPAEPSAHPPRVRVIGTLAQLLLWESTGQCVPLDLLLRTLDDLADCAVRGAGATSPDPTGGDHLAELTAVARSVTTRSLLRLRSETPTGRMLVLAVRGRLATLSLGNAWTTARSIRSLLEAWSAGFPQDSRLIGSLRAGGPPPAALRTEAVVIPGARVGSTVISSVVAGEPSLNVS